MLARLNLGQSHHASKLLHRCGKAGATVVLQFGQSERDGPARGRLNSGSKHQRSDRLELLVHAEPFARWIRR